MIYLLNQIRCTCNKKHKESHLPAISQKAETNQNLFLFIASNLFSGIVKPSFLAPHLRIKKFTMKKFIISALAIVFSVASAFAQDVQKGKTQKTPDEKSSRFTQRMTRELSLDAAQQERVQAINLERFKNIEESKVQAGLDAPARRQKLKEVEDNYFNNLKGVLSADQFTKFQAMKAEMKEKAFERRKKK